LNSPYIAITNDRHDAKSQKSQKIFPLPDQQHSALKTRTIHINLFRCNIHIL